MMRKEREKKAFIIVSVLGKKIILDGSSAKGADQS